ncbi:hypothetical protein U8335_18750 [Roseiconus lacunae]|uniref:hypothetical protein n=1 Tax=Roseiconus lacunae TaxID=2605694 RepID=UPI00308FDF6A|nr:hypothetical protein U8335_18750 [Stieleria sp. HD01]
MTEAKDTTEPTQALPDAARIREIAREVVRRLASASNLADADAAIAESVKPTTTHRLITIETLEGLVGEKSIVVASQGVVTPAAKEEALRRGIEIVRQSKGKSSSAAASKTVTEAASASERSSADPFEQQLTRRGIQIPDDLTIVWSDTPAVEVFEQIRSGRRAVMISQWGDIDRFAKEFSPDAWVLDREKLTLSAAVNAAARIVKRGAR